LSGGGWSRRCPGPGPGPLHALADHTDYEHHWLINPDTGEIAFWTADTGIDGQTP